MVDAALLAANAVSVSFPHSRGWFRDRTRVQAVSDVSFTLQRGEVLGIVGESGSGKTTLALALLDLQQPSSGEIRLDGTPIATIPRRQFARRVQPVFQDPYSSLNPRRSVARTIAQPLRLHRIGGPAEQRDRAQAMMGRVGLSARLADRLPASLSGGQRQRVAIARALIMQPDLVICDEPTSALDVSVQAQILNLLQDLRAELGLTYVLISHNLAVVEQIATSVAVMYRGRLVEQAPTGSLFARPRHPYTVALLRSVLTPDPELGLPEADEAEATQEPVPTGCAFAPRCPHAMPLCRIRAPLPHHADGHVVECHLAAVDDPEADAP